MAPASAPPAGGSQLRAEQGAAPGLQPSAWPGAAVHTRAPLRTAALSEVTLGGACRLGDSGTQARVCRTGSGTACLVPWCFRCSSRTFSVQAVFDSRPRLSQVRGSLALLALPSSNLCLSLPPTRGGEPPIFISPLRTQSSVPPHSSLSPMAHVPPTPQPHSCLLYPAALFPSKSLGFQTPPTCACAALPLMLGEISVLLKPKAWHAEGPRQMFVE